MKADKRISAGFIPPDKLAADFYEKKGEPPFCSEKGRFSFLVGYSGGADSSFLLHVLYDRAREIGAKLYAAHINHGIRGEEALRDREHCRAVCESLGVKLFVLDADVPRIAAETGKSLEDAARSVRYDFFDKIMKENDIPFLCTAHNAEDNLETMLFRLARGSGSKGLCGIPPVRELPEGRLALRPMLGMKKADIIDICDACGIKYVYDSTNSDTDISRNNIRANVLPVLWQINPDAAECALRTAASLREDCELLDGLAADFLSSGDAKKLPELAELKKPILVRVLAALYSEHSSVMLEHTHMEALIKLVRMGKKHSSVSLPDKIKCTVEDGSLVFLPDTREKTAEEPLFEETPLSDGVTLLGERYIIIRESGIYTNPSLCSQQIQTENGNVYKLFTKQTLLSDKISGELFARARVPSDRIISGRMSKDIRKLYSEHALPIGERSSYPLVCDEKGVVWVPNIAVRDGAKADKAKKDPASIWLYVYKKEL